jgi:transposase
MNITTIGIDLAKTSFSLVGSDKHGKIVLRKTVNRGKLLSVIAQCPPCLIGLEACSGAHYWAREFEKLGHQVRIIAVKFIEPYRKGGKNDNNDAEAICEAVRRPNIWYVPVKSADQQAALCVHRVRQGVVRERTAWINRLRGLLAEFGIVIPKGRYAVQSAVPVILTDPENGLPELARQMIHDTWLSIQQANDQILSYDQALARLAREDETAKRLLTIPGVDEQVATGVVASVPDPRLFKNSRQLRPGWGWCHANIRRVARYGLCASLNAGINTCACVWSMARGPWSPIWVINRITSVAGSGI